MRRRSLAVLSLALFAFILAACAPGTPAADGSGLRVVATTGQIGDAVANIAGDAVRLTTMFGPGIDPHLFVPTEGDVATLGEAEIIFYNGLHLEAQMTRVMEQLGEQGRIVVALGDQLPPDRLLTWEANTPFDPHIWNDPELWIEVVKGIRDTLSQADPDNAALFAANTERYIAEILETDAFIREQVARIPPELRVMVTAHDAFGYFARTYGLEVRGLQGISTESEAGTQDVQTLAEFIAARRIPAIFVETTVPPRTIEAVQAAVKSRGFEVVIGGSLYSDALGTSGTPEGTYVGMLRHNSQTLADALSQGG